MRTVIFILMISIYNISFGQLNDVSRIIMKSSPTTYESIRLLSLKKHGASNQLVSKEINEQCVAFSLIINSDDLNSNLLLKAMSENTYEKSKFNELINSGNITRTFSLVIDWVRVIEYYNSNKTYYR
jgi:hypothetical protein